MVDFSTKDPFIQVHDAIWAALEADNSVNDFPSLVAVGNRIKYTGADRSPEKRQHAAADFPDVRLKPRGGPYFSPGRGASSRTTFLVKRWSLEIATGDQRVDGDERLFAIQWAALQAIVDADNLGLDFVQNVSFVDEAQDVEGVEQIDGDVRLNQWAVVLVIEVVMNIDTETWLRRTT